MKAQSVYLNNFLSFNTYNAVTIEEITSYIFINDNDQPADIALVFGTWNAWKGSVEKAADLYQKGLVPRIIVSGGLNEETGIVEGAAMAGEALALGIARRDILIEDQSRNTLENVIFSLKIIDREIGLVNIKTITAIVKNFHARRCMMTLRKHTPPFIQLRIAAYDSPHFDFNKSNWMQSENGQQKVLEEVEKIKKYLAQGDLAEL
ncbi:MAG: YdcF family protein [Bacteroidota bacterium]